MAQFKCSVNEQSKATELPLMRVHGSAAQNPHMRAFWGATLSFFLAFFGWFAFTGLELDVATTLGICENQKYPADQFPKRKAYLKYKNLKTMEAYCQYGRDDKNNPTDCKPVPSSVALAQACNGTNVGICATEGQKLRYRPEVLAACVCSAGTTCAASLSNAGTASVASTICTRIGLGMALERFGPVNVQTMLLVFGAIWVAAGGLVNAVWNYILIRFFIGMVGAAFVTNQFWNSLMFAPQVVGSANGISAGWGNLGGGVTTVFMPYALVEPFKAQGVHEDMAWRYAMLVPAGLLLLTAVGLKLLCWDAPTARRFSPSMVGKSKTVTVWDYLRVLQDVRVWVMMFQYSACFGTELAMYNQLPRHFSTYFQMRSSDAAAMASIFGLTNIFSRPLGGILSDMVFRRWGFPGRVWLQFVVFVLEAVFLFAFGCISNDMPVEAACVVLFIFSVFCEMGCGTSYGIVPFMNKEQMACVGALVGAGGNLGAVIASQAFYIPISDDLLPYKVHAGYVMFWALLTPVFYWPQYGGMFWRPTVPKVADALPEGGAKVVGAAHVPELQEPQQPEEAVAVR